MGKRKTEQRIKAIELHKQGFSRRQIAERVGVCPDTIKTWIAMYQNGQKDLLEDRPHIKSSSQQPKIAAVKAHIVEGKTLAETTALYGISDTSLLRRWCREYREQAVYRLPNRGVRQVSYNMKTQPQEYKNSRCR